MPSRQPDCSVIIGFRGMPPCGHLQERGRQARRRGGGGEAPGLGLSRRQLGQNGQETLSGVAEPGVTWMQKGTTLGPSATSRYASPRPFLLLSDTEVCQSGRRWDGSDLLRLQMDQVLQKQDCRLLTGGSASVRLGSCRSSPLPLRQWANRSVRRRCGAGPLGLQNDHAGLKLNNETCSAGVWGRQPPHPMRKQRGFRSSLLMLKTLLLVCWVKKLTCP